MNLQYHPYHEDLLAHTAERVLRQAADALPDLSSVAVLASDPLAAAQLRARLCTQAEQRGHAALLGLRVTTLRDWIETRTPDERAPLNEPARRLLLVEALRQHRGLFGEDDPWRVADSLLELFDELTLYRADLPAGVDALTERLTRGYGIGGPPPAALGREAQIVHRLWLAWQEQTAALQQPDPWSQYLRKLRAQTHPDAGEPFYILCGLQAAAPAEREWIAARLRAGRATWLLHGRPPGRSSLPDQALDDCLALTGGDTEAIAADTLPRGRFLDAVYPAADQDLRTRAAGLAADWPDSPVAGQLATLATDSAEQEARAIDIQVRRWLLAGKRRIGIVTEDRRLARRVRALLERAGILLADAGGWALSTTSAAACVERWLQSVEEDFAHQPLLDLLKSPLLCTDADRAAHLACVYRLEHDIIQHENIARGLERYRRHIEYRRTRLHWPAEFVEPLHALLDRLDAAARPLQRLREDHHSARLLLAQLRVSLSTLGIWERLDADAAGRRVVALWEELDAAAQCAPLSLSWQEFRIWLGRALEDKTFRPGLATGPVQLLALEQSLLLNFDAVVVGACDREHLPGRDRARAFFNTGVRRELGLPTWEQRLALRLYHFRRLLEAAPEVLLTWRREDQGEPLLPSPWLEGLETLHRLAYGNGLEDTALKALAQAAERCAVAMPQPAPLPATPMQPRPSIPVMLLPETISASSHQHLIDCPYRYFASDCLQLSPTEAVRELLQKSDYGERVHRCLEAFHGDVPGLPGPFVQQLDATTRTAAIDLLQRITTAVFARDLEDNFQHRGWLKRWWQLIPGYVDWQIRRAAEWQVAQVEARIEQPFSTGIRLKGRLDRIDSQSGQQAIVDYKTGGIPSQEQIDAGEAVQLPFYALLDPEPVARVEYLKLDGERVQTKGVLEGERLSEVREAVAARLATVQSALAAGAPLPAWGDPDSCRHCPMDGVCRRAAWE